jgi:hypothetical protein
MSWVERLKEEWPKTFLQVSLSALGFLIALVINSGLANRSEKDTYISMLKSVRAEAEINNTIWHDSFDRYYDHGGLVLREFTLLSTSQCLANPVFVKHATQADLDRLNAYMLNLSLANGYRRISESVYLTGERDPELRQRITDQWKKALDASREKITAVEHLSD